MIEGDTIRRIREAVAAGHLAQPFRGADVNHVLKSTSPGCFFRSIGSQSRGQYSAVCSDQSRALLSRLSTSARSSSIRKGGLFLCIIAWQFGHTGTRSVFGLTTYSFPIEESGTT